MSDKLSRLKTIGFTVVGRWELSGGGISFVSSDADASPNFLYAFVVDGELVYIGKSSLALSKRMQRYRTPPRDPSKGGSTNRKTHDRIREQLAQGRRVEVFVLRDIRYLHFGEFHLNIAAGLEDSLILKLDPPWNGGKKESRDESLEPIDPT